MNRLQIDLLGRLLIIITIVCTISISNLGGITKAGASTISQTNNDGQEVTSSRSKTYNDTDKAWTYTGKWSRDKLRRTLGGQIHISYAIGDQAAISVTGSRITLIYSTAREYGELDVYVDEVKIHTLNQKKSKTSHQKEWDSPELAPGTHTLKLVHASGKAVNIDAIKVRGPKTPPGPLQPNVPTVAATPTLIPPVLPGITASPLPTETSVIVLSPIPTDIVPAESPTLPSVPDVPSSPTPVEVVPPTLTVVPSLEPSLTASPIPSPLPSPTASPEPTRTTAAPIDPAPTNTALPTFTSTVAPPATNTATVINTPTVTNTAAATVTSTSSTTQRAFYISATGNNADGKSWASAWSGLDRVNWSILQPGDTIYISGGSTSQTYTGTLRVPAGTTGITITKGVDAGHNGEVIFDGGSSTQYGVSINAERTPVKNLIVSNLTFKNYTVAGVYGSGQNSGGLQGITVDKCKFLNFNRAGVFFEGNNNLNNNFNIVVKNSYFDDNNARTSQSDGIYVQVLKDFTADHNYIILDNNYTGVADVHSDNIQSFWVDNVMYSNNVVIQKSNKTLGTQMLFTENGYGEHVFLNNVFIRDTPYAEDSAMRLKSADGSTFMAKVIGNTYYGKGRILNSSTVTTIKNNIFYGISQPTSERPIYITSSGSVITNNIFYDPNNQFPSAWGGMDVNPMFVSIDFNTIDLHLQSNSPAINAGANLGSQYSIDIEGKSRGSVWDIGAYEAP